MQGASISEVPVTLHPDGRKAHAPHLRTFRDGWRTLRFYLMYSPRWLFLVPGFALVLVGLSGYAVALPGVTVSGVRIDVHTLLFASLSILCGYQAILFGVFTKTFAIGEGMLPADARMTRLYKLINLERGLVAGVLAAVAGVALLLVAVGQWRQAGFGDLDYSQTMRWVIPGVTLTALGVQTIFSSFFLSILGLRRR
jgi:hypothetical protein